MVRGARGRPQLGRLGGSGVNLAIGPFAVASVLLVVGGIAKAARPGDTATALRLVGLPVDEGFVRVGGALEAALGAWAVLGATRVAAILVGISYLAFFSFVAFAMVRRVPIASCGCFGRADTPPSTVHLVVDVVAAALAAAVALDPGDDLRRVIEDQPIGGVPYVLLVVIGVAAALVALTALPRALAGNGSRVEE